MTPPTVVNFFNPFNSVINQVTNQLIIDTAATCNDGAAFNYWFAAMIMKSFKEDQANRKEVILALAKNLERPGGELIDINGKTITNGNITDAETQIGMQALAIGIYILKITQNNQELKTFKIAKKQ